MDTSVERRGQLEIGIVTHNGHVFAAFGSSVNGRHVTGYTRLRNGSSSLTRWDGTTMLSCRSEVVLKYHDGSVSLIFRLTQNRFVIGYALGDDGMLFRGELLTDTNDDDARREAIKVAEYWAEIDAEDEADPWHGEPVESECDYPDW
jgi:hypothetical protein